MVAEDSQEAGLIVFLDTDLVISLDPITIFVAIVSLIAVSLATIVTTISFVITTVSSSVLISLRLDFHIDGIPTTTLTITPITTTRRYTTTGIGTVWPPRCRRSSPSAATITDQLTE